MWGHHGRTALLETHFVYEEKRVVSALNELTGTDRGPAS